MLALVTDRTNQPDMEEWRVPQGSTKGWGRGTEQVSYEITSPWLPPNREDLGKPYPAVVP